MTVYPNGAPTDDQWVEDASTPTLKNRFYKEELYGKEPVEGYPRRVQDMSLPAVEREYFKRSVLGTLWGNLSDKVSSLIATSPSVISSLDTWFSRKPMPEPGYLNVKDFGGIGDGISNDLPAIQAAIDAAKNTAKMVYIPRGTWKTLGPIRSVEGNLHLKVHPSAIIERHANNAMFVNGVQKSTVEGGSNILIEGGTWDCRGREVNTDGSVFALGWAKNLVIKNLHAKNVNLSHIVELAGCENVLFEDLTFSGFLSSLTKEAFQIERLTPGGFPYFNVSNGKGCKNVEMIRCHQLNPDAGYSRWPVAFGNHDGSDNIGVDGLRVTDCDFGELTKSIFLMDRYRNVVLDTVTGSGNNQSEVTGIYGQETNVSILRSDLRHGTTNCLVINKATKVLIDQSYLNGHYGISIRATKDLTLRNSDVIGNTWDAILINNIASVAGLEQYNLLFDNIKVAGNHGIAVNGTNGKVSRLTLKDFNTASTLKGQGVAIEGGNVYDITFMGGKFNLVSSAKVVRINSTPTAKVIASGVMYSSVVTEFTNAPTQVTENGNAAVL